MSRVRAVMDERSVHPARTVVLLPYIHLLAVATEAWGAEAGNGVAPRFETTQTWSGSQGFEPEADGLARDMGRNLLTARAWIERAGLHGRADLLAGRLVEAALQLAPIASAQPPSRRAAWAVRARAAVATGLDAPQLALESAVARIAVEWAAASTYPADSLLEGRALTEADLLVVVQGLHAEPLAEALAALDPVRSIKLRMDEPGPSGEVRLHAAGDPAEEAEQAAACVIRHVNAGRTPVALAAVDRVLTRRIHALLSARNIAVRDETGWKLSTTRRAADVMLALRACAWNAGTDVVIDLLKNSPRARPFEVLALERRIRRAEYVREWSSLRALDLGEGAVPALVERVDAWRGSMAATRTVVQWCGALRDLLEQSGQWDVLLRDAAGAGIVAALRLVEEDLEELRRLPQAERRWSLADFTAWVNETLESESFKPEPKSRELVAILPASQLLGRAFPALVMPGCDEMRLVPSPEPAGMWTPAQRAQLGLPTREMIEAETRASWRQAMLTPHCDVLWRRTDESGETLLPSVLVQTLQMERKLQLAPEPRAPRDIEARQTPRPSARGMLLPITQLSASSYGDLRSCPYKFFAMRQLGLQEADEIEAEVGKREFGNWLHRVLGAFHEALHASPVPAGPLRRELLDVSAQEITRSMRFDESEFLPFAAAWPKVRDGYLAWLVRHEAAERAVFESAEAVQELQLGPVKLVGRIDRIDRLPDRSAMVMDYKTEAAKTSGDRVKDPGEDTQLAFYAALLPDDTLRAAYVNIGEKGETKTFEQAAVVEARDHLVQGILHDVALISAGGVLPAHGEGKVCDYCGARGLCRKDFWS
ncbi:MAG: PD-(D/E)XK nuclease family protein [Ramlibacter sp.]